MLRRFFSFHTSPVSKDQEFDGAPQITTQAWPTSPPRLPLQKEVLLILSPQDAESLFREEDFEFELKDTTTVKHTSALVEHTERSILVIDTRALAADLVALQRTSPG